MEANLQMAKRNDRLAVNLSEAAEVFGLSLPTMAKLVRVDGFPALRVGKRWLIPAQSLNAWLVNAASAQKVFE